jgi:phage-related protein (TIGR01555 family)
VTLKGEFVPFLIRQRLQGWGLSKTERLIEPLRAYRNGVNVLYELLSEAKIDVMSIKDLNTTLASGQDDLIYKRIQCASDIKNYKSTLVIDQDDKYEQKQLTLGGLSEILRELKYEISSAVDLPLSKIFGIQASGFNSGNEDILKYNAKVMTETRPKCILQLKRVLRIICKILFDFVPTDLNVKFEELTLMTQEQIELKKQNEFMRLKDLHVMKFLQTQELAEELKSKNILERDTAALRGELPEFVEDQAEDMQIDEEGLKI